MRRKSIARGSWRTRRRPGACIGRCRALRLLAWIVSHDLLSLLALTLVYDREWKVEHQSFRGIRLDLFLTPQIQPDAETITDEFRSVYALLARRFGPLAAGYFGIVQARSWKGNPGWRFGSNQIFVAASRPGAVSMKKPVPGAFLGHEIAPFWTEGATGPAASFLTEGWAVWAESLILENEFGRRRSGSSGTIERPSISSHMTAKRACLRTRTMPVLPVSKAHGCFTCWKTPSAAMVFKRQLRNTAAGHSRSHPVGRS